VTGLSPDISNKQSQIIYLLHLYLYVVGYNLMVLCMRVLSYLTKKLIYLAPINSTCISSATPNRSQR